MKCHETLLFPIENSTPSAVLRDVQSVHDVNKLLKPHDSVVSSRRRRPLVHPKTVALLGGM